MKFAILGDTHFDFWPNTNFKEKHFHLQFRKLLESAQADVLLLPGDIGHYNSQNLKCLEYMRQYFDRIVVTFGNHDYYLITNSVREKYQYRENGSMKHWVFGHTHHNFSRTYERADGKSVQIHCNSIGYPDKGKIPKEFGINPWRL